MLVLNQLVIVVVVFLSNGAVTLMHTIQIFARFHLPWSLPYKATLKMNGYGTVMTKFNQTHTYWYIFHY